MTHLEVIAVKMIRGPPHIKVGIYAGRNVHVNACMRTCAHKRARAVTVCSVYLGVRGSGLWELALSPSYSTGS